MRELQEVFANVYGLDLRGWRLEQATGISEDGSVIVGFGINPSGNTEAWIAVIPEPTAGTLLAGGLVGLALARRTETRIVSNAPKLQA